MRHQDLTKDQILSQPKLNLHGLTLILFSMEDPHTSSISWKKKKEQHVFREYKYSVTRMYGRHCCILDPGLLLTENTRHGICSVFGKFVCPGFQLKIDLLSKAF